MAIAKEHNGIVIAASILAGIVGLIFGWFPGADLGFLLCIWMISFVLILSKSTVSKLRAPVARFFMALLASGFIVAAGVELVTKLTLPIFFIVNPILNALATYRILRTASKLFASDDPEELSSTFFQNVLAVLALIFGFAN
jgi:hypothetical protein